MIVRLALVLAALSLVALRPAIAQAAPTNDDFANATVVSSFPFFDTVDSSTATTEPNEPQNCNYGYRTVWWAITAPGNGAIRVDASGSGFWDNLLRVYRDNGSGIGGLGFVNCAWYSNQLSVPVRAGETYYVQGSDIWYGGGALRLNVSFTPAPANDDFANATVIGSLPYSQNIDMSTASTEPGEPVPSCGYGNATSSVWYAYTPSVSGSLSASANGWPPEVAAYTGDSLGNLTQIGCRAWGNLLTFHVDAGTTYYFQASNFWGYTSWLQFSLQVAPDPVASFNYYPGDPSTFDSVQFYDSSYDPGQVGISSESWDFGDGATASGCCPTHRYAADADYVAVLTVATPDGRTASLKRTIHVQTHDVAITKLTAPQSASAGQTRQISVGVQSNRYPETVQVQLLKALPTGGYAVIGTLTQSVPVRSSNRTTSFDFSYTFTADDASIGKATFKAVATIVNARDALPGDNEAVADPTKVSR